MKKLLFTFLMCILGFGAFQVHSQTLTKADQKVVSKRVKEFKKEKWNTQNALGLESVLSRHYEQLKNPNVKEAIGQATGSGAISTLESQAHFNAITQYARTCGGMLRARIEDDQKNISGSALDNLVSGYEMILAKKIDREIIPSFFLYKEEGGKITVRAYCTYNLRQIEQDSNSALDQALKEQGLSFEYGNNIKDFIDQGFKSN